MDGAMATRRKQRQWKAWSDDNEWHNGNAMATTAMDGATATAIEGTTVMRQQRW
jgi:hypothetical protein